MTPETPALDASTDEAADTAFVEDLLPALDSNEGEDYSKAVASLARRFPNGQSREAQQRATAIVAMALGGMPKRKIAKVFGIKPASVSMVLYRARRAGKCNDLRVRLEHDSAALAVESLNTHLRAKDKDVTLETLKGLGYFRNYNHTKNEGGGGFVMPALVVNVNVQQGAAPLPGQAADFSEAVVGRPRADEGEIIDAG